MNNLFYNNSNNYMWCLNKKPFDLYDKMAFISLEEIKYVFIAN